MISTIKTYLDLWIEKISFALVTYKEYTLNLYQLILGAVVLFSGMYLIRLLTKKIKQWEYLNSLNEQYQSVPIVKLLRVILYVLLFVAFLVILGFPFEIFKNLWNFTLFTIRDSSVSLGNLIFGLLFFIFAFRINKIFKPKTDKYLDQTFNLEISTKKTVVTIIEYIFFFIILLFSLSIVGIPLTAFTVIGGSLAIGVGLGSQNLINNFISGFVLMGERTTKIGDIIEVDGNSGKVEKIGFRSTIIKTFNNLRLIIPNSTLLENNVINWSLTDKILRRKITAGVAYGADAVKVHDLLSAVVKQHDKVLTDPAPFITFSNMGDSALIFDIYFFIDMTGSRGALLIESDVRTAVYQALNKEKINIPFPQRDNHIFLSKPIDVNLKKDQ